jgi:UDP-N-acetylmuramoyl-L-alanyl-D-glutamate--2,6-diaminopimelate ligase
MYDLYKLLSKTVYTADKSIDGFKVNRVCCDSRAVLPGDAFFCIKGEKKSGCDYISDALRRGASAIISEKKPNDISSQVVFITVSDSRSAYAYALSATYDDPADKMKMIAVTGTNGKTTVSGMIRNALMLAGKKCAQIGTLGAEFDSEYTSLDTMTTPDPDVLYALLDEYRKKGAEYVVMEASSHALALGKLDAIEFDVAAITNMSAEHLDFHTDMEGYYTAKASLFARCKKGVFLCDDFYTVKMYEEATCDKVACSTLTKKYGTYAENVAFSFENGTSLCMVDENGTLVLHSKIPAAFTAPNVLLAAVVLREIGLTGKQIYDGIAMLNGVEGRMERVETGRDFSVFIDFAHTPDALSRLLSGVRRIKKPSERIVTLFGCGGDRDKSKRSLMGAVSSRLSDFVIITEDNSRSEDSAEIIDRIMLEFDKSCPHIRIDNRRKAIEYAIENAGKGDIILLCGKGHEKYEIGKNGKVPFCEREIVLNALQMRKKNGR